MKIQLTSLFLWTTVGSMSMAQGEFRPGFIIKPNGDSINGQVIYRLSGSNFKECIFKATKKSRKEHLKPIDIIAYGFWRDKRYEAKVLPNAKSDLPVFAEVIVKGYVSLLFYNNTYYLQKDSLIELTPNKQFATENNGIKYLKKNKQYVGILNTQFADCELSANKIDYEQKDLVNLVQNYNRCKGKIGIFYKANLPATKIDYLLFSGLTSSSPNLDLSENSFSSSRSIFFGAGLDFSAPRLNDKLVFSLEAWYLTNVYQGYSEKIGFNSIQRIDNVINMSNIKLPISIKYNFGKDIQTPYIKFGVLQYIKLNSSLKTIVESESNGIVATEIQQGELNGGSLQGIWLSLGCTNLIRYRYKIFYEVRYEKVSGRLTSTSNSRDEFSNFHLLFGLKF